MTYNVQSCVCKSALQFTNVTIVRVIKTKGVFSSLTLCVTGGEHVTITGSGFTGHVRVFFDQEEVTIRSSTGGEIIVELPPLRPRSYAVRLFVEDKGLADTRYTQTHRHTHRR